MRTSVCRMAALLMVCFVAGCGAGGSNPPAVKADANIAFMGDSITYGWSLPTTNFGVSGNTTTQMLGRFKFDVLGHGYKAVVILGGTNDLRFLTESLDAGVSDAVANLQAMAEEAESQNILVVLCEIPPLVDEEDQVVAMNAAIIALAKAHHYRLVDYYTPMAGHPEYFVDGIHPNSYGYFVMQQALSKVLPLDY
jgi:lysophospholipase L1-like esterase